VNALKPGARLNPRYVRSAALEQRILQQETLRGWKGNRRRAELSFVQGRAAMTVSGSWLVNEMAGKIPDDFELRRDELSVSPTGSPIPARFQVSSDCFFVFATGIRSGNASPSISCDS